MSWTLSAIVLCGTLALFAAGTQGGKTFGFPKTSHRVSTLDRAVGEHRNSPKVTRQDEETCTPYSDEYYRRIEALECNEEYQRAVREDIKTSNCTNLYYLPDDYDDTNLCSVIDDRVGVNVTCSEECSLKQLGYFYCKYLGEDLVSIDRECGETVVGAGDCSFNDENFCVFEDFYQSSKFQTVYDKCFVESNVSDGSCSDECKEALDDFTDAQGCCVTYLFDAFFDTDVKRSANLFSTCGVRVPGVCSSFSPPRKFRDCAHDGDGDGNDGDGDGKDGDGNGKDGDVHATPTVFLSIILIMVSLFSVNS